MELFDVAPTSSLSCRLQQKLQGLPAQGREGRRAGPPRGAWGEGGGEGELIELINHLRYIYIYIIYGWFPGGACSMLFFGSKGPAQDQYSDYQAL